MFYQAVDLAELAVIYDMCQMKSSEMDLWAVTKCNTDCSVFGLEMVITHSTVKISLHKTFRIINRYNINQFINLVKIILFNLFPI